jgi:hypothetical protein
MEMQAARRPETAESVTGLVVNGQSHELSPVRSGTLLAGEGSLQAEDGLADG